MVKGNHNLIVNNTNGIVHVHNNYLGRGPGTRLYGGGAEMNIGSDPEVFCEIVVDETAFLMPKLYHLVMHYKCEKTQEQEATITVRPYTREFEQDKVYYTTTFPLVETGGEFVDLTPVLIDTPLGGFAPQKTSVRIHFRDMQGLFRIQHFKLIPPHAEDSETIGTALWFHNWYQELHEKLTSDGVLPQLPDNLEALKEGAQKIDAAKIEQDGARGHGPLHEAHNKTEEIANQVLQDAALPILEGWDECLDKLDLGNNKELLQFLVIAQATPVLLADYCMQGDMQKERLMTLLKDDTELLKNMLIHGGPKRHLYGQAMDVYMEIQEKMQEGKSVLPKLQLACALELCYPIVAFNSTDTIDAVERYLYYERQYLAGELDPAFESLTVWELRMALTSTAKSEELEWCKDMMKSFRPDHVYSRDYTRMGGDVHYNKPRADREADSITYHDILCYGAYCGGRAKFGRLTVHCFGVPSWGLVTPGHATYLFWTPDGFTRLYGGGRWEDRRAYDFFNEVVARKLLGDEEYFRKVEVLAAMSAWADEEPPDCHPHPDSAWYTLSNLQRRRFGNKPEPKAVLKEDLEIESTINAVAEREAPESEEVSKQDDGTILVPSFARTSDSNALFMKCYEGGMQVYVKDKWELEYKIPGDLIPEGKKYNLTASVCVAHNEDLAPLEFDMNGEVVKVDLPYTTGLWGETDPVEVELGGGDETTIKVSRTEPYHAITIKEFKFTPI